MFKCQNKNLIYYFVSFFVNQLDPEGCDSSPKTLFWRCCYCEIFSLFCTSLAYLHDWNCQQFEIDHLTVVEAYQLQKAHLYLKTQCFGYVFYRGGWCFLLILEALLEKILLGNVIESIFQAQVQQCQDSLVLNQI